MNIVYATNTKRELKAKIVLFCLLIYSYYTLQSFDIEPIKVHLGSILEIVKLHDANYQPSGVLDYVVFK